MDIHYRTCYPSSVLQQAAAVFAMYRKTQEICTINTIIRFFYFEVANPILCYNINNKDLIAALL